LTLSKGVPKISAQNLDFTGWIFSDSLVNTISISIQISKSIISKINTNTVEQMHENYGL
jgi:hypothetical protein